MTRGEVAIVRAVVYAGLFDYPLTLDQIHATLIGVTMSRDEVLTTYADSPRLRAVVEYRDGFFVPAGRIDLIAERARREARSRECLRCYRRVLQWICAIPFTRMVALSGSIAHLNLEYGGDLDVFIVTSGHHVWTVAVTILLLTKLVGARRIVCANFVMSDANLAVEQQDLFTANQILHLRPLIGGQVLDGFLAANPFVRRAYPNRPVPAANEFELSLSPTCARVKASLEWLMARPSSAIEWLCRRAYSWHLRRRSVTWSSPEQVRLRPDCLKLHTKSHRRSVLQRFDDEVDIALGRRDRAAIA
jgi:hypothetical protein